MLDFKFIAVHNFISGLFIVLISSYSLSWQTYTAFYVGFKSFSTIVTVLHNYLNYSYSLLVWEREKTKSAREM